MPETILELANIHKSFGGHKVLKGISLSVQKGEFITFLGPSGCGKTTMLRIIAGLDFPQSGQVFLNGQDVTSLAPDKRNVNTIFQNYALFPHMNIAQNVGYGLKIKGVKKNEIKARVSQMLKLVQLEGLEKQMPDKISGGQKQRVAIARAAVNNPDVLLLDEPLGALDLQLRRYLQGELKRIQKELGITFIYITHDQEEAMNMSDRIVVMKDGLFEQTGAPVEVYDHPKTSFVAGFVGMANILKGTVIESKDGVLSITVGEHKMQVNAQASLPQGANATVCVRSENLRLSLEPSENSIPAVVRENTYANGILRVRLTLLDGTEVFSSRQGVHHTLEVGQKVFLSFTPEHGVLVDSEGHDEA